MKNLTILLLLMISSSMLSQTSKVYVYVNVDSARITLDEIYQGIALNGLPFVIETRKGTHELIVEKENRAHHKQVFSIRKGDSIQIFCSLRSNQNLSIPLSSSGKPEEPVFLVAEEPATFNGGDLSDFNKWITEHLVYPESLLSKGMAGKVYVQFVVDKSGKIETANVLVGMNKLMDEEAIRVVKSSPKWTPAKQGGREVKQIFTIPIFFTTWKTQK